MQIPVSLADRLAVSSQRWPVLHHDLDDSESQDSVPLLQQARFWCINWESRLTILNIGKWREKQKAGSLKALAWNAEDDAFSCSRYQGKFPFKPLIVWFPKIFGCMTQILLADRLLFDFETNERFVAWFPRSIGWMDILCCWDICIHGGVGWMCSSVRF